MNQNNKNKVGVGIAAATAAAALGAYFLYGSKNAVKNRKAVKSWMVRAKAEVMERLENMEEVTEGAYQDVVNKVISGYKGAKGVSSTEIAALAVDLKKHWNALKPLVKRTKKSNSGSKSSASKPKRSSSAGSKSKGQGSPTSKK